MLNMMCLQGRLVRDPELRRTGNGTPVATFTLACDRDFNKGDAQKTDFIDVVAWRGTGEFAAKYFQKGSMAIVTGRLQIREWTGNDGGKRKSAEIVAENIWFGASKRETDTKQLDAGQNPDAAPTYPTELEPLDGDDADIPF